MTAIAAVDTARWDINGQVAGPPVHQLPGGRWRDGVLIHCHASGTDTASLVDDVARFRDLGYRAVGTGCRARRRGHPRRAQGTPLRARSTFLPEEQAWSTEA